MLRIVESWRRYDHPAAVHKRHSDRTVALRPYRRSRRQQGLSGPEFRSPTQAGTAGGLGHSNIPELDEEQERSSGLSGLLPSRESDVVLLLLARRGAASALTRCCASSSPTRQAVRRLAERVLFQRPPGPAVGQLSIEKGAGKTEKRVSGGHVTVARVPTGTAARFPTQASLRRFP